LVRGGGVEAWIESLGQRSDDAVLACAQVGADEFAKAFARVFAFFPNRGLEDPDSRLSGVDAWSSEQRDQFRRLDDACLELLRSGDLIDVSVRRFVSEHPEDLPQRVAEL
jgi:hypothetical protein